MAGGLCAGSYGVPCMPHLGVRAPPGAAPFFNISASQTLLLSLLSARAMWFSTWDLDRFSSGFELRGPLNVQNRLRMRAFRTNGLLRILAPCGAGRKLQTRPFTFIFRFPTSRFPLTTSNHIFPFPCSRYPQLHIHILRHTPSIPRTPSRNLWHSIGFWATPLQQSAPQHHKFKS